MRFLLTGAAGFIGSHILEELLNLNQKVLAIDNLSTGFNQNINAVASKKHIEDGSFQFIEMDILNYKELHRKIHLFRPDVILHQAALGSVPRSIDKPMDTFDNNCKGFMNVLVAAKENNIKRLVFASSSSVYGDDHFQIKRETRLGIQLSPYAISKRENELFALNFSRLYDIEVIGLRYFNVFGRRQNPNGEYAAVIPKWINLMRKNKTVSIYGDGTQARDFTYVKNVVTANMYASVTENPRAVNKIYNIATGSAYSLNQLYAMLFNKVHPKDSNYEYLKQRKGDVSYSMADISRAQIYLGYKAKYHLQQGLDLMFSTEGK